MADFTPIPTMGHFPGRVKRGGEFLDNAIGRYKAVGEGQMIAMIGFGLAALSFLVLPHQMPFLLVPMAFAFFGGAGIGQARMFLHLYVNIDRPTQVLKGSYDPLPGDRVPK